MQLVWSQASGCLTTLAPGTPPQLSPLVTVAGFLLCQTPLLACRRRLQQEGGIPLIIKSKTQELNTVPPIDAEEAIRIGRWAVATGKLQELREAIGLTRYAMAELLQVAWPTYSNWESRPVNLRRETAARVGRFFNIAVHELEILQQNGIDIKGMIPFHVVATVLGIPQEQLLYRYRNGEFEATDLGILGLWVFQSDLDELRS